MSKITARKNGGKPKPPEKPYPEFPLFPHANGQWTKKVRGKQHHFGIWADPDAALAKWESHRDYLLTGRTPLANVEGVTVRDLCNGFLTFKRGRVATGELTIGMFAEYNRSTDAIMATLGRGRLVSDLDASDFGRLREYLSRDRGLVALSGLIRKCRIAFKWGFDAGLLDRPPRYGQSFAPPSRSVLRQERATRGRLDFTGDEVRAILAKAEASGKAGLHLRALILLGVNCGLGTSDIAHLPAAALNLAGGWLDYPRPKTGVGRRCRLWPETVTAVRTAMAKRPKEKDPESKGLAFLTPHGHPYLRFRGDKCSVNGIAEPFRKLCETAKINRAGRGFYGLRRTLATIADEARDPVALRHMLGHAAPSSDMSDVYRQAIGDERLIAVSEHVRHWLFAKVKQKTGAKQKT